jgi:hypothetical protein
MPELLLDCGFDVFLQKQQQHESRLHAMPLNVKFK